MNRHRGETVSHMRRHNRLNSDGDKASALIISDRWGNPFEGGIAAAIRIFAGIFHSLGMSTYCTVLQMTPEEEEDAKIFKVNLIYPKPRGSLQRTKQNPTWLLSYEAYFQNLKARERDIDIVLGFGLATSEAAMFINELEYRDAKFYIANLWQRDEILRIPGVIGCDKKECQKLINMLSEQIQKASLLIAIDENTFEYVSQLPTDLTKLQVLPQPDERYYDFKAPIIPKTNNPTFRILSFLEEHDVDEFPSHRVLADAMNLVAESFKSMNKTPPKWEILGVPEGKDRLIRKKLKPHSHLNVIPMSLPTVKQIEQELQSCHLVLFPESPGMNSLHLLLSVMAIGIPLITKRYSPCHKLIEKLVANEVNIEHMLTSMNPDDTEELRQKIVHMLTNLQCRVQSAGEVKTCLMKSAGQLSESCNRAFKEKIRHDIRRRPIATAQCAMGPFVTSQHRNIDTCNPNEENTAAGGNPGRPTAESLLGAPTDQHMESSATSSTSQSKETIFTIRGHISKEHVEENASKTTREPDSDDRECPTWPAITISSTQNELKLYVRIKGGVPDEEQTMTDVGNAYYNLVEVRDHVSERLKSLHLDIVFIRNDTGSVIYIMQCNTLDALEFLWQQYESLELKKLITSVTITDETLKKIGALYLEIQTALNIEEYDTCKMALTKTGQTASEHEETTPPEALAETNRVLRSECETLRKQNDTLRAECEILKGQKEENDNEIQTHIIKYQKLEDDYKKLLKTTESKRLDPSARSIKKQVSQDVFTEKEEAESLPSVAKRRKVTEASMESGSQEDWLMRTLSGAKEGQPFKFPQGLAFIGNRLAVCDSGKSVVQIINQDYILEAELGTFDGQFPKPFRPVNVAVSKHKHYFIIDQGNLQIVVCDETSKIIKLLNLPGAHEPKGITLQNEFILVTDPGGFKLIKLTIDGELIGDGCNDGFPHSVAVNSNDVILVTDNALSCIKCFDSSLNFLHKHCSPGNAQGQLLYPRGIAIDKGDNIYICNGNNNRIDKLRPDGKWECTPFQMYSPEYISVAKDGRIAVACGGSGSKEIVIFSPC